MTRDLKELGESRVQRERTARCHCVSPSAQAGTSEGLSELRTECDKEPAELQAGGGGGSGRACKLKKCSVVPHVVTAGSN